MLIIFACQNGYKFITADAVNGRVLKGVAQDMAAAPDILVSVIVTVVIVDCLKIVDIHH